MGVGSISVHSTNKQRLTASATIFSPSNHDGTASNVTSKLFVEKTRSQFLLSTMSSSEKKKTHIHADPRERDYLTCWLGSWPKPETAHVNRRHATPHCNKNIAACKRPCTCSTIWQENSDLIVEKGHKNMSSNPTENNVRSLYEN